MTIFGGCFGYPMMYNRVDFGGFANPFPSVFGNMGYSSMVAQPMPTTFANSSFPSIDFTEAGRTIWDSVLNPDSPYNKAMKDVYEQYEKQSKESNSSGMQNNFCYPFQMFNSGYINPFIQNYYNNKKDVEKKGVVSEPEETDSQKKSNNANISYDAAELKSKWSKKKELPDAFYEKVINISKKIKCDPNDLMGVMWVETAKTFAASAKNPHGSATGLIQFTSDTAKSLGTTTDELRAMTPVEQLDYVEKYLVANKASAGYKDNETLDRGTLYSLVFLPGRSKRAVLTTKGENFYEQNRILDYNKDGNITKADLNSVITDSIA